MDDNSEWTWESRYGSFPLADATTTDAAEIMHRRYFAGRLDMEELLAEARARAIHLATRQRQAAAIRERLARAWEGR